MSLHAGSATLDITPRTPNHLAGYANRDHPHEGIHDPISLRALYIANGSETLVLVSADILWFREEIADPIHAVVQDQLGIPPECVMLCGTHTHSAPTTSGPDRNAAYLHFLEAQTLGAIAIARAGTESVSVRIAHGESRIGINRRERRPGGEIVLGENPEGPIDRKIILTSLEGESGRIAEICSFATHGTVMGGDSYQISGDWCGLAASALEESSEGAFLFMNGGSANVNPRGRTRPSSFEVAENLAEEFMRDIQTTRQTFGTADDDSILSGAFKTIELPRKSGDIENGMGRTARIRIQGIRIGPLRIVGFPGEVFSETAMGVKEAVAPITVAVNSYTAGGSAGYVPVKEAYDTGGYEVRVSPYSEEAEGVLRSAFIDLAGALG
jgi:neutral ceramidase